MFIVQIFNKCLSLILVNIKITKVHEKIKNFPIFGGEFDDITSEWFNTVGTVMLFSMIIDIVTSNLSILFIYIDYIFRCCDSGCTCGKTTKKKRKEKYYKLYIGPIFPLEVRYAGILTNLVISLILGPGMTLLYIVFYINIIVTFLVDKYMVLCYHRNPPQYNLNFTRIFIVITGIALICHLFIAIWIYGEPSLFVDLPSEYG